MLKLFASALLTIEKLPNHIRPINIAGGEEIDISFLSDIIADVTGFHGTVVFDQTKPNGQLRRSIDGTLASQILQYSPQESLREGIEEVYEWYKQERKDNDGNK